MATLTADITFRFTSNLGFELDNNIVLSGGEVYADTATSVKLTMPSGKFWRWDSTTTNPYSDLTSGIFMFIRHMTTGIWILGDDIAADDTSAYRTDADVAIDTLDFTYFPDGLYIMDFTIATDMNTYTKSLNTMYLGDVDDCIKSKIEDWMAANCCNSCKKGAETTKKVINEMLIFRKAIDYDIAENKYTAADDKFKALQSLCDEGTFSCNCS